MTQEPDQHTKRK